MPAKELELPAIGKIKVYKRRGIRAMRISITGNGELRLTMPTWVPFRAGLEFLKSKEQWILDNRPAPKETLISGKQIGKAHRLLFVPDASVDSVRTRITGTEIRIIYPLYSPKTLPEIQAAAEKASVRALRQQAEKLLPDRLALLAKQYGFTYGSVSIKQLKRRWGSCSHKRDIVFNLYLMQLPWELIDYVLVHELVHTKHLNHGEDFWNEFLRCLPNAKQLRKQIKTYQPHLLPQ
jgi:predicted metal-dependent hydrolase